MNMIGDFRYGDRVVTVDRDRYNNLYHPGCYGTVVDPEALPYHHHSSSELNVMMDATVRENTTFGVPPHGEPTHQYTYPYEVDLVTGNYQTFHQGDVIRHYSGRGIVSGAFHGRWGVIDTVEPDNRYFVTLFADLDALTRNDRDRGVTQVAESRELIKVDYDRLKEHYDYHNPRPAPDPVNMESTPTEGASTMTMPTEIDGLVLETVNGTIDLRRDGSIWFDGNVMDTISPRDLPHMNAQDLVTRMLSAAEPQRTRVTIEIRVSAILNTGDEAEASRTAEGFARGLVEDGVHRACDLLDEDSVDADVNVTEAENTK